MALTTVAFVLPFGKWETVKVTSAQNAAIWSCLTWNQPVLFCYDASLWENCPRTLYTLWVSSIKVNILSIKVLISLAATNAHILSSLDLHFNLFWSLKWCLSSFYYSVKQGLCSSMFPSNKGCALPLLSYLCSVSFFYHLADVRPMC